MAIGTNDFDDFDDLDDYGNYSEEDNYQSVNEQTTTQDNMNYEDEDPYSEDSYRSNDPEDIISELLREKGIEDKSRVKFANDYGQIEERDWNTLSKQEQLEILSNQEDEYENIPTLEEQMDDDEIALINEIRRSNMTPGEYLKYIHDTGINNYARNLANQHIHYEVDDIADDDLFLIDIISKVGEENVSDQELQDMLDSAKSNEATYQKQVQAIRNEYKRLEYNNRQQDEMLQQQAQLNRYNSFAESVEDAIRNFTEIGGYELNMDESEMEEVYDFIVGVDKAGVNNFSKVLNSPEVLVRMAWFALNWENAIQDINDYWSDQIKQVREYSYVRGLQDANQRGKSQMVIQKNNNSKSYNNQYDLDDEF